VDPELRPALLALVEPDIRGDPRSPLRWTTKSTRTLAGELTRQGRKVSADTIADLLRAEGFVLQANAKSPEGRRHPNRDDQFRYINEQARRHIDAGQPVISVDTKKNEYASQGRLGRPPARPVTVNARDPADRLVAKGAPAAIRNASANRAWITVGADHDTAAFAVALVRWWWRARGPHDYQHATRLLITANVGGSHQDRTRDWKHELAAFAAETGLDVTVCHLPRGTSRWSVVEHRLFCRFTMNWQGRRLTSHDVIVNSVAATATGAGLRLRAELDADTDTRPDGGTVTDAQVDALAMTPHHFHGDWYYTLHPASSRPDPTGSLVTAEDEGARPPLDPE
jgi:hypothetical protein